MLESLNSYSVICDKAGREPNSAEFMAWAFLGVAPKWFQEIIGEDNENTN